MSAQEKEATQKLVLRLPRSLWLKIVEAKWRNRKSVNQLIVEALEKVKWV